MCKLLVKITSTLNMNKDRKALYRQSDFSSTARYKSLTFYVADREVQPELFKLRSSLCSMSHWGLDSGQGTCKKKRHL